LGRLLVLIAIVALVFWLLRRYRRSLDGDGKPGRAEIEDMVRCAHCGIHLPRSESVEGAGGHFCSSEHRRLHGS
jgi:uncharacterized protein